MGVSREYLIFSVATIASATFVILTIYSGMEKHEKDRVLQPRITMSQRSNDHFLQNCPATQALRRHTQRHGCSSLGFCDKETYKLNKIITNPSYLRNIYVSERYRTIICLIPKATSMNWVRTLMILEGAINSTNGLAPQEIVNAAKKHLRVLGQYKPDKRLGILRNYSSAIFVRNPYSRLLSAFRDRLETYPNRNMLHRKWFNKNIYLKFGNHSPAEMPDRSMPSEKYNVTFKEFVDYYLSVEKTQDVHWREQYKVCPPCFDYDYIGNVETYADDFKQTVQIFDATSKVPLVKAPHATNSSEDGVLRRYYGTLSDLQMKKLEKLLSSDMKLFGYSIPRAIQRNSF
ncbi:carbohydrate sulfotransferase 9-like [Strongylocentrotus purpuratus]|uniref:Carbohydrate sulfotransferase n=1 Tax=Strongylocentrotus purpuratus TaxID=7668 RepID=A0A7M7PRN9_STRPU|nr:carbohydrate sulfotransferase 9-like [Strongylocentrotus purpuratus]